MSKPLFCQDAGEIVVFRHSSQAIVASIAFIILLPLSIHFFHNIELCGCRENIEKCTTGQHPVRALSHDMPDSPRSRSVSGDGRRLSRRSLMTTHTRDAAHNSERRKYSTAYASMIFVCLTLLLVTGVGLMGLY